MIDFLDMVYKWAPASYISFVLTSLATIVGYLLRRKVKLIWGTKTNHMHVLRSGKGKQNNAKIHTAHYVIQNSGALPATNVEIVLNYPPDEVSIWPQRMYSLQPNNEGRLVIKLDFLAPKEFIDLVLLCYNRDLPWLLGVKCPENIGKQVDIRYHRQLPNFVYGAMIVAMFLGVMFLIEKVIKLVASVPL